MKLLIKNNLYFGECMRPENVSWYDFFLEKSLLSDEDLEKVRNGFLVNQDWEISEPSDYQEKQDQKLKDQKKMECKRLIENKYKQHDQINTLLFGTEKEIDEMKVYIDKVLTEYRTKWKDADYSNLSS